MEAKQKPIAPAKIHPNSVTAPMAMAELEIMKVEDAKSAVDKSPEIRNIALLLVVVLGVTLFSQIISYLLVGSFNNIQTDFFSAFVSSNGVLGITLLLAQITAVSILLFTRNTAHAKTIILIAGISFGVALVNGIIGFRVGPTIMTDVAILVVNLLILRKVLKAYLEL